jgi:hypothetical protein
MPIGIQDFEDIRRSDYAYVDKTAYVYRLASEGKPYFLSRLRRFGKSLLLSTMKAYFLGKKELPFEDGERPQLAIADLEKDWTEHPVFHIDLNTGKYDSPAILESVLNDYLRKDEETWGVSLSETLPMRFLDLIRRAAKMSGQKAFDIRNFAGGITIDPESIGEYRIQENPVPVLYQSGYLTITGYDREANLYMLGFPNEEVEYGFLNTLLPYYGPGPGERDFHVGKFYTDLRAGDTDGFMRRLKAFFSSVPSDLHERGERYYQTVFYLVFRLLGQYVGAEVRSTAGRADAVVMTKDRVYVFEFKPAGNGTAEDAGRREERSW